jgi:anti-sigma B factor antagonist
MSTARARQRLVLDHRLDGGVVVVRVTGEVDVSTSGLLRDGLLVAMTGENRWNLVVNLASVSLIDSTGVGVLVGVWHRIRARNGCLALVPSLQVQRVLEMTGLTSTFSVYDTEAEAIQACRQTTG